MGDKLPCGCYWTRESYGDRLWECGDHKSGKLKGYGSASEPMTHEERVDFTNLLRDGGFEVIDIA